MRLIRRGRPPEPAPGDLRQKPAEAPKAAGPDSTTETDWSLVCAAPASGGGDRPCEVNTTLTIRGQSAPFARIAFVRPAKDKPARIIALVPVNVSTAPGAPLFSRIGSLATFLVATAVLIAQRSTAVAQVVNQQSTGSTGSGGTQPFDADGGNGGDASATRVDVTISPPSGTAAVTLMSQGGIGGNGADSAAFISLGNGGGVGRTTSVTTTDSGSITPNGEGVHNIFALSQGGVGGKRGDVDVSLGGGGTGGAPGNVTVNNVLDLSATGLGAVGILAQSVGAAGGDGGGAQICFICAGGRGAACRWRQRDRNAGRKRACGACRSPVATS
jgi:hypothetical protein